MAVAEAHGRVRRKHVEVALALFVPEPDPFAARKNDGKRIVILRAVAALQSDHVAHKKVLSTARGKVGPDCNYIRRDKRFATRVGPLDRAKFACERSGEARREGVDRQLRVGREAGREY